MTICVAHDSHYICTCICRCTWSDCTWIMKFTSDFTNLTSFESSFSTICYIYKNKTSFLFIYHVLIGELFLKCMRYQKMLLKHSYRWLSLTSSLFFRDLDDCSANRNIYWKHWHQLTCRWPLEMCIKSQTSSPFVMWNGC